MSDWWPAFSRERGNEQYRTIFGSGSFHRGSGSFELQAQTALERPLTYTNPNPFVVDLYIDDVFKCTASGRSTCPTTVTPGPHRVREVRREDGRTFLLRTIDFPSINVQKGHVPPPSPRVGINQEPQTKLDRLKAELQELKNQPTIYQLNRHADKAIHLAKKIRDDLRRRSMCMAALRVLNKYRPGEARKELHRITAETGEDFFGDSSDFQTLPGTAALGKPLRWNPREKMVNFMKQVTDELPWEKVRGFVEYIKENYSENE